MVEGGGLENRCGATHRGFESLSLRSSWRDGSVAESTSLLRKRVGNCSVGSNPTLSVAYKALKLLQKLTFVVKFPIHSRTNQT